MFRGKGKPLCRKVRGMLSEYIDNGLDSENKSFVEHHLETCEACSKELESLRMTVQLLHMVAEVPVPRSFTVIVPEPRRESAFGPASMRWLRPATAIVAVALVVLLMGDFLHGFENNVRSNSGPGNVTLSGVQLAPSSAAEQQPMVAVPGVMGEMALTTAKAVGYTDYTIVSSSAATEQQPMVAVPGVMGQMSLATAKAVGYTDYSIVRSVPSSAVSQAAAPPMATAPGNEGLTGAGVMAPPGEAGVGWPLRQAEIGLGAAVFVLLTLLIYARRQRRKKVSAR